MQSPAAALYRKIYSCCGHLSYLLFKLSCLFPFYFYVIINSKEMITVSEKMIGMTKKEVFETMRHLDNRKYHTLFNALYFDTIRHLHSQTTKDVLASLEIFSAVYTENILYPFVSDLIETNNKKITEDIKQLFAK